ncbi:hypothetical protein U91I_02015 [alpha proteobacterium U9-1i]|nr:hypothetical protein U91I_02015 [alpha proteobacterium U9-1i]
MLRAFIGAFCALAVAGVASAQQWAGSDPSRSPRAFGQGDVDFVLSELCFPFLLQGIDGVALARARGLETAFGTQDWASGGRAYLVGQADVMVSFDDADDGRACTFIIRSGNPARYSDAISARLATWPSQWTPAPVQVAPGNFSSRTILCGPEQGPHDIAFVSIGGEQGTPPVLMTLARLAERNERCAPAPARR